MERIARTKSVAASAALACGEAIRILSLTSRYPSAHSALRASFGTAVGRLKENEGICAPSEGRVSWDFRGMSGCRPLKTPTAQIPSGEAAVDITLSRGYGTYDTYRDVHVRSGFCVVGAMMSEKNQQMLQNEVCGYFADCPEVALAYLFGSRAEGNAAPSSDYDFGVLLVPDAAPDCRYRIQHELLEVLNATEVDVVVLGEAPVTLAYNVIASGQLVYEKDRATRVDFEANLMSKYCDYLPILRRQREDILKETRG